MDLQAIKDRARHILLENSEHPPCILAEAEGGGLTYLALEDMPPTSPQRQRALFGVGYHLASRDQHLTEAVFITEAWMAQRPPGEVLTLLPAEDPERREVLLVFRHTFYHEREFALLHLLRNTEGDVVDVIEEKNALKTLESGLTDAFWAGYRAGMEGGSS